MHRDLVIAKDANGTPLKRLIVNATDRLFYLAHPELEAAVESGESWPVGFPSEYVYVFDEAIFYEMDDCFCKTRKVPKELWQKLSQYRRSSQR